MVENSIIIEKGFE